MIWQSLYLFQGGESLRLHPGFSGGGTGMLIVKAQDSEGDDGEVSDAP